jgi:tetratricopeptide (TPR) repeat protein
LASADEALASGLTSLAASFYTEAATLATDDPQLYERTQIGLASCMLVKNEFRRALDILTPLVDSPAKLVRLTIAQVGENELLAAASTLNKITPIELSPADLPWYHIARGLIALADNKITTAQGAFDQAITESAGESRELQQQHIRMLDYLARLKLGNPSDSLVAELRQATSSHQGDILGAQYARELAIALSQRGDDAGALNELRKLPPLPPDERDACTLLMGIILKPETPAGRTELLKVVKNKAKPDLQNIALQCLALSVERASPADLSTISETIYDELTKQITLSPDPRTLDTINLIRAKIAFEAKSYDKAELAASDLLEKSPQSKLRSDALRILSAAAWQKKSYRRAADYLNQLKSLISGPLQARISLVAADCLYLAAKDSPSNYAAAATAYAVAQPLLATPAERGNTLFLRVECELKTNNLAGAEKAIAESQLTPAVDHDSLLRCEWLIIVWLRTHGKVEEGLARVEKIMHNNPHLSEGFRISFLWQKALLSLDSRNYDAASEIAQEIATIAKYLPPTAPARLRDKIPTLLSKAALLKARAVLSAGETTNAKSDFKLLREQYPDEEATAASYIVEGRYQASQGRNGEAQKTFRSAYERYKNSALSEYAANGLFESAQQSALLARAGGEQNEYGKQAIQDFQTFTKDFPRNALVTQARLNQADLFRSLNQFSDALQVYDELIRNLPDSPDRWRAELSRADCLFANATSAAEANGNSSVTARNSRVKLAIDTYSRLYSLPDKPLDMKAEAGYKWGRSIAELKPDQETGRTEANIRLESEKVFWSVYNQLLQDPKTAEALGYNGRYWVVRSLFDLAKQYEKEGRSQEARNAYKLILDNNRAYHLKPERSLPGQNWAHYRFSQLGSPAIPPAIAPADTSS